MAQFYIRERINGEPRINTQMIFPNELAAQKAAERIPCAECIIDRDNKRTIKLRVVDQFSFSNILALGGLRA